jgi:transcriptional regulator GlxA family with amidase domain
VNAITSQAIHRRMIVVVLPEVNLLDLAGPMQVFSSATHLEADYEQITCATQSEVVSAQGVTLARLLPLPTVTAVDLILIPGVSLDAYATGQITIDPVLLAWLRQALHIGAQVVSVCTGAFILGEAGLLDGRRCTTHWEVTGHLQARYPQAKVVENTLFVQDGPICTSAGIASGIDLALYLVEQAYGPIFAAQVARYLVIYLRRNGAQPQSSIYLAYRTHLHPGVHHAQDYLVQTAPAPVALPALAEVAAMPLRSFTRAFKEATGLTPTQYQQRLRLEVAANLLHTSDLSIDAVAKRAGFDDVRHFRRMWQRVFGAAPSLSRRS